MVTWARLVAQEWHCLVRYEARDRGGLASFVITTTGTYYCL